MCTAVPWRTIKCAWRKWFFMCTDFASCSPDFAPCNVWLFSILKQRLSGWKWSGKRACPNWQSLWHWPYPVPVCTQNVIETVETVYSKRGRMCFGGFKSFRWIRLFLPGLQPNCHKKWYPPCNAKEKDSSYNFASQTPRWRLFFYFFIFFTPTSFQSI